jgi:hypothetical protein
MRQSKSSCKASTASKTTNALIHHSCDMCSLCCVSSETLSERPQPDGDALSLPLRRLVFHRLNSSRACGT